MVIAMPNTAATISRFNLCINLLPLAFFVFLGQALIILAVSPEHNLNHGPHSQYIDKSVAV